MSVMRDEMEVKIRWASKKSLTAGQAQDVAEALISAGYYKWNPEAIGEVEVIAPQTTRVGEVISHKGIAYHRAAAEGGNS